MEIVDGEKSNEDVQICQIKLISGEYIVSEINVELGHFEHYSKISLYLPAAIIESRTDDEGGYFYLRRWLPFSTANIIDIQVKDIIYIDYVSEELKSMYEEYVAVEFETEFLKEEESEPSEEELNAKKLLH